MEWLALFSLAGHTLLAGAAAGDGALDGFA